MKMDEDRELSLNEVEERRLQMVMEKSAVGDVGSGESAQPPLEEVKVDEAEQMAAAAAEDSGAAIHLSILPTTPPDPACHANHAALAALTTRTTLPTQAFHRRRRGRPRRSPTC